MLLKSQLISKYGISGNGLKILALLLMITDHVGAVLLPQYRIMRYIGRLSFPIYAFLVTEGLLHTHSVYRYMLRLLAFALISEVPFDLAIYGTVVKVSDQNVFFTLFIGLAVIYAVSLVPDMSKGFAVCLAGMGLAVMLKTDYSAYGVFMIYCFYIFREMPAAMVVSIGLTNLVMGLGGTGSQKYAVFAMLPIMLYSGRKTYGDSDADAGGHTVRKYMFYAIYPLHLVILYLIKRIWL